MRETFLPLPDAAPGTRRTLRVLGFGSPGARPKAVVQAGLHADELPGVLVALHLAEALRAEAAAGRVRGEVALVPAANPIGLAQFVGDTHLGRHDLGRHANFNRGWPDVTDEVAAAVGPRLGPDPAANVTLVRAAALAAAGGLPAFSEGAALRRHLFGLAADADLALDLHCDLDAVPHLYALTSLWPEAADLAAEMGAEAVLLADRSGGHPWDEALSAPWGELRARFPGRPIPTACLAATLELRGRLDVDDALAAADAAALLRFLRRRGVLAGDPGPPPPPRAVATPLAGVAPVRAPAAGLILFHARPGETVAEGQLLAAIVDPLGAGPGARTEVRSPVAGRVFARALHRLARPGDVLLKVAGDRPLAGRGPGTPLLDD